MPGTLSRNLILCFTKMKWASTSDHTSAIMKNFNTLYENSSINNSPSSRMSLSRSSSFDDEEDEMSTTPADFATVCASHRFFFSSPGHSNSIIESTSSSALTAASDSNNESLVRDSVVVPTYSPDPYLDFRQSMQEMVEARKLVDVKSNWEQLHELLLCYLALNPKTTHEVIVTAFADLLVGLMARSDDVMVVAHTDQIL